MNREEIPTPALLLDADRFERNLARMAAHAKKSGKHLIVGFQQRFDPKSKGFSSTAIPSGGGVVRNIAATPDGRLYLACSGVNKVAVAEVRR